MYEQINQSSQTNFSYYSVHPSSQPSITHHPNPSAQQCPNQPHVPDPCYYHGSYPASYPTVDPQPAFNSDPSAPSPNWVVKQSAPIKYFPAVEPSTNVASASVSHDTSSYSRLAGHNFLGKQFKRKVKKPKVVPMKAVGNQGVWCKLCEIECPSVQDYDKHVSGKKHSKSMKKLLVPSCVPSGNLSSQASSVVGGISNVPTALEAKKQKLVDGGAASHSVRLCTICNVASNGEIAYADHIAGKKHIAKERALSISTNSNPVSASSTANISQADNTPKPVNVGFVSCEICKISCTDFQGLLVHRLGKKHKKNEEKLRTSISNMSTPASTSTPALSMNPPTAAVDCAEAIKQIGPEPEPVQSKIARQMEQNDLETKKRKILENGGTSDAVRACTICNVVCNNQVVFVTHLAGQKHAAMVKQAEARAAAPELPLTANL